MRSGEAYAHAADSPELRETQFGYRESGVGGPKTPGPGPRGCASAGRLDNPPKERREGYLDLTPRTKKAQQALESLHVEDAPNAADVLMDVGDEEEQEVVVDNDAPPLRGRKRGNRRRKRQMYRPDGYMHTAYLPQRDSFLGVRCLPLKHVSTCHV